VETCPERRIDPVRFSDGNTAGTCLDIFEFLTTDRESSVCLITFFFRLRRPIDNGIFFVLSRGVVRKK
jgi:hypothetical protein